MENEAQCLPSQLTHAHTLPSIYLCVYLYICLSECLSLCLPACLSVCLSTCLSIHPSIYSLVCQMVIQLHSRLPSPRPTPALRQCVMILVCNILATYFMREKNDLLPCAYLCAYSCTCVCVFMPACHPLKDGHSVVNKQDICLKSYITSGKTLWKCALPGYLSLLFPVSLRLTGSELHDRTGVRNKQKKSDTCRSFYIHRNMN